MFALWVSLGAYSTWFFGKAKQYEALEKLIHVRAKYIIRCIYKNIIEDMIDVSLPDKNLFKLHAEVCKTLASPKRLEILNLLRDGEKSVSELVELADVLQANASQHLAILRQRRIVNTRKEGTNVYYSIASPKIIKACDLLREVLLEQLAESAQLVKQVMGM